MEGGSVARHYDAVNAAGPSSVAAMDAPALRRTNRRRRRGAWALAGAAAFGAMVLLARAHRAAPPSATGLATDAERERGAAAAGVGAWLRRERRQAEGGSDDAVMDGPSASGRRVADDDDAAAARGDDGDDGDPSAPVEVEIDLRQFEEVQLFLKSQGITGNSTADEVLQWVPASLVLRLWPRRAAGALGADAAAGYVAFNLVMTSDGEVADASYLIVMTLRGEIVSLKVGVARTHRTTTTKRELNSPPQHNLQSTSYHHMNTVVIVSLVVQL
jgi:hypothetical protein